MTFFPYISPVSSFYPSFYDFVLKSTCNIFSINKSILIMNVQTAAQNYSGCIKMRHTFLKQGEIPEGHLNAYGENKQLTP